MTANMKRIRVFLIISWLIARLKLSIELSRLTIYRFLPRSAVHEIARNTKSLPMSHWIFEADRISLVYFHSEHNNLVIREFKYDSNN